MKTKHHCPMPVASLEAIVATNPDALMDWADDHAPQWVWLREIGYNPEAKGHGFAQSLIIWIVEHGSLTDGQIAAVDRWRAPKDDKAQFRYKRRKWKGKGDYKKDKSQDENEQEQFTPAKRASLLSALEAVVMVKFSPTSAWEGMAAFNSKSIAQQYVQACVDNNRNNHGLEYKLVDLQTGETLWTAKL